MYSTFVPGGLSHSASHRAGLFNSETLMTRAGAAMTINILAVPGDGQFNPEGAPTGAAVRAEAGDRQKSIAALGLTTNDFGPFFSPATGIGYLRLKTERYAAISVAMWIASLPLPSG